VPSAEFVKPGDSFRIVIDGKEVGRIAVDDFMPGPGSADGVDRA
jgi:hypothetical protein